MSVVGRLLLRFADRWGRKWARFENSTEGRDALRRFRIAYWQARLGAFGDGSHIYPHVVVHAPGKVRIGRRVNIAEFVHIWGGGGVEIGDDVIIASHTVITSQTHDPAAKVFRDSHVMAPVRIGANCWIGAGAIVMPGVTIGPGSIVGAQAVVTRDVAPGSIVAGVPAKALERPAAPGPAGPA